MVCVMAFGVILGLPGAGRAQEWRGGYVSGHVGMSVIPMGSAADNVVLFDTNLDGTLDDTVRTAAGANAFSPGFCAGDSATALPSGGCAIDNDGVDFGVRGGYNWQMGKFVVGAVADLAAPDHVDSVTAFSTTPAFYTFTRELDWLSGFRGRAGVGWPRMLIYGTGGAALAQIGHSFATSNVVNTFVENAEDVAWGYQLGGGAEFKLGRLTFGGEYLWTTMMDEDRYTVRAQGPAPATNPFILTNAGGTDFQRADRLEFGALRFTVGLGF
jgi:outer membrane immunogenic protein